MSSIAIAAYILSVVLLFAKLVFTVSLQGRLRVHQRRFRYPEDAAYWAGETVLDEGEDIERAQRLLGNDGESQPYFIALGAAYVALGAWPLGALLYFGAYVGSRFAHAVYLLRPRQPHRTLAFSAGILVLLGLSLHVSVEAVGRLF